MILNTDFITKITYIYIYIYRHTYASVLLET